MKTKYPDAALLVLRLTVGGLMLFHGLAKVQNGVESIGGNLAEIGLPAFISYGVYIGEVVAPILLLIGFRTRLAALVIIFNMLMVFVLVQHKNLFMLKEKGGGWAVELDMFFLLCALSLFLSGGGRYKVGKTYHAWD